MDKEAIKKNFSRYARYYDRYSTVQDFCASRLMRKIGSNGFSKILDIGCGTGNFTSLLKARFPNARIKAVDISEEMIGVACQKLKGEDVEFIVGDAQEIDLKENFDFIGSNAAFQWFADLDKTLVKYRECLCDGGVIAFSTFGPLTFFELDNSLKGLFGRGSSVNSYSFLEIAAIKSMLERLFRDVELEVELYKERYDSLGELLRKIKYTGERGIGVNNGGVWTTKVVKELERIYRTNFKDITATYQIFFCKGTR